MPDRITSHNQKGGITAKNVTVTGGQVRAQTAPPRTKAKTWVYISGVVGFIAAVVAILDYFGIKPW